MAWPELVANLDGVCLEHLGIPVLYDPASGSPVTITAIFDEAYVRVEAGEAGVSSCQPMIFCRVSDIPADIKTDDPNITVNGVLYRGVEFQPDGQGGIRIFMHKVA